MSLINGKTPIQTGQEFAIEQHEQAKKEKLRQDKQRVREALGDNYPQLKRR